MDDAMNALIYHWAWMMIGAPGHRKRFNLPHGLILPRLDAAEVSGPYSAKHTQESGPENSLSVLFRQHEFFYVSLEFSKEHIDVLQRKAYVGERRS